MQTGTSQKHVIAQPEQTVLHFPDGLLGFEHIKDYTISDFDHDVPLKWMQAVGEPNISFVIVDPFCFMPDYDVKLDSQHVHGLDVTDIDHIYFYVLTTIPKDNPLGMTANLQGPIIVNAANQWAKQLVLGKGVYHTRHPLFAPSPGEHEKK